MFLDKTMNLEKIQVNSYQPFESQTKIINIAKMDISICQNIAHKQHLFYCIKGSLFCTTSKISSPGQAD